MNVSVVLDLLNLMMPSAGLFSASTGIFTRAGVTGIDLTIEVNKNNCLNFC